MTIDQIKNYGISTNTWVDLSIAVPHGFLMSNEGYIFTSPTTKLYFEESSELVFVRYDNTIGGVEDSTVGKYHCVYDINSITMIF